MQHSDPYDASTGLSTDGEVTGRGWVILPETGRGTVEDGGGGVPSNAALAESPLHHASHGPPPRNGEDLTPFTPDPVFTPALKLRFLDELSNHGNVRVAAGRVGVSRSGAYLARRRDAGFASGWRSALCLARDHAEAVLAERALEGVEEPVYYRGELIAVRRRFDSRLLLAHLTRLDALCAEDEVALRGAEQFERVLAGVGELSDQRADALADLPTRAEVAERAATRASHGSYAAERRAVAQALADYDAKEAELAAAVDAVLAGEVLRDFDGLSPQDEREAPFEVKGLGGLVHTKTRRCSAIGGRKSAAGQPVYLLDRRGRDEASIACGALSMRNIFVC